MRNDQAKCFGFSGATVESVEEILALCGVGEAK